MIVEELISQNASEAIESMARQEGWWVWIPRRTDLTISLKTRIEKATRIYSQDPYNKMENELREGESGWIWRLASENSRVVWEIWLCFQGIAFSLITIFWSPLFCSKRQPAKYETS
jgi:hypothetical protein